MVTFKTFYDSKHVKQALKVPKNMAHVHTVIIPPTASWGNLPDRLRTHREILKRDCNAFVGMTIQRVGRDGLQTAVTKKSSGRWKWAAINLITGDGVMYTQSYSEQSGHLTSFNIKKGHWDLLRDVVKKRAIAMYWFEAALSKHMATGGSLMIADREAFEHDFQ